MNDFFEDAGLVIFSIKSDRSGVPIYCAELAKFAAGLGVKVCIVTRVNGPAFAGLQSCIRVIEFPALTNQFSISALREGFKVVKEVFSRVSDCPVVLNGMLLGVAGRCLARRLGKTIFVHHGLAFDSGFGVVRRLVFGCVEFLLVNFSPAENVVISEKNLVQLRKLSFSKNRKRIKLISNISFMETLRPLSNDVQDMSLRFVCVAGFRTQKNHRRLFEAFQKTEVNANLYLIGPGVDCVECRALANQILCEKKQKAVRFVGVSDDVASFYTSNSICVLGSDYEGFPLAALEAAQLGVPVVMTPVSGSEELGRSGLAFVAQDFSPCSLGVELDLAANVLRDGQWNHVSAANKANKVFEKKEFFNRWTAVLFD